MNRRVILQWSSLPGREMALGPLPGGLPRNETWTPNADVCEGTDDVVVRMELAGVRREHVRITLEDNLLVVEGVRRDPSCRDPSNPYRFHQLEIEYGAFERRVTLPFPVDGGRVSACLSSGFLEIRLPRARETKPLAVRIEVES